MEIQLFVILLLSSYEITIDSPAMVPQPVRKQFSFNLIHINLLQ